MICLKSFFSIPSAAQKNFESLDGNPSFWIPVKCFVTIKLWDSEGSAKIIQWVLVMTSGAQKANLDMSLKYTINIINTCCNLP